MAAAAWDEGPSRRSSNRLVTVLVPLLAGVFSLALGADFNYDLRHYHFYNGYALLHGRFDHDFAPSGIQSFFNPTQDLLYYLGIRHLPPRIFGFLLGAVHGLNLVLVHRIALVVLDGDQGRRGLALLATLVAGFGSNMVSLLGTTTGDALVSLPALLALLLTLRAAGRPGIAAGLAMGASAGLKLTMLGCAAALTLAILARDPLAFVKRPRFALGGLLGFLGAGGWWYARLLEHFQNPVFPFLNGVFRSPFFRATNMIEARFVAHSAWEAFTLPFTMALGLTSGLQEIRFREPRYLLVALALVVFALELWRRRREGARGTRLPDAPRLLLVFWVAAYLFWAYGLHYHRYALVLELLAPVLGLALLRTLPRGRAPAVAAFVVVALLGSRSVSWGRKPWSDAWFDVRLPQLDRAAASLVILAGERVAYVAPFFPASTRFVGLTRRGSPGLDGLIAERLAAHEGPKLLLPGVGATPDDARRFGLAPVSGCLVIQSREGPLCLYPLGPAGP